MDVSRLVLPFSFFRAVCKISCCQVNTTSKQGIKQLRISFCSFLLLSFFLEVTRDHEVAGGKIPGPQLLKTVLVIYFYAV